MTTPSLAKKPLKLAIIGGGPSAFYVASRILKLLPPGSGTSRTPSSGPSSSSSAGSSLRGDGSSKSTTRDAAEAEGDNVRVHIFDRLWAPHGLVRYGVAPDHPEVKNCTHKFDQTALDPRFKFFGNVNVLTSLPASNTLTTTSSSTSATPETEPKSHPQPEPHPPNAIPIPLTSLLKSYTHICFATGAPIARTHPSLPAYIPPSPDERRAEDTPTPASRHIPALSLVHFYTSHPSSPPPPPLHLIKHVTIIGNGNVALDVARILLSPLSHLQKYDIKEEVLEVLKRSSVEHVSIVGRRGWREAAFSGKEVREMMGVEGVGFVPLKEDVLIEGGEGLTRPQKRILEILKEGSKAKLGTTKKTWSLEFMRQPVGLFPAPSSPTASPTPFLSPQNQNQNQTPTQEHHHPLHLHLEHTTLHPTTQRPTGTGVVSVLPTDLVISSLGFEGERGGVWFDSGSGHLRSSTVFKSTVLDGGVGSSNSSSGEAKTGTGVGVEAADDASKPKPKPNPVGMGKVLDTNNVPVPGVYASGWAGMGAKGVLAKTMLDAYAVAGGIVDDWQGGVGVPPAPDILSRLGSPGADGVADKGADEDASATTTDRDLDAVPEEVRKALEEGGVTTYEDWKLIDAEEVRRGALDGKGKERERMEWEGERGAREFLRGRRASEN